MQHHHHCRQVPPPPLPRQPENLMLADSHAIIPLEPLTQSSGIIEQEHNLCQQQLWEQQLFQQPQEQLQLVQPQQQTNPLDMYEPRPVQISPVPSSALQPVQLQQHPLQCSLQQWQLQAAFAGAYSAVKYSAQCIATLTEHLGPHSLQPLLQQLGQQQLQQQQHLQQLQQLQRQPQQHAQFFEAPTLQACHNTSVTRPDAQCMMQLARLHWHLGGT